jgi:hypothetical protein
MRIVNRLRGPIGIISAWLLVVAVGSAMVWTVISRAGDDLMPAASASLRASAPAAEESVPTPAPSKPQETGKATLISKEPKPSEPEPPTVTESAPPVEETTPPSRPGNDPPPKDDDDGQWGDGHWGDGQWGGNNDKTPPATVRATWQGSPGAVVAECVGWKITLVSAPANSGFHVEAATFGQRGIRVVFESQDGSGQKTTVFGKCHNGKPIFFDKTEGGPGDGGDNSGE